MSKPTFLLCSTPAHLKAAHDLRLRVFHDEQRFPADTEVDEYDPVSAHFILVDPSSSGADDSLSALGVLRLVPYPRPTTEVLSPPASTSSSPLGEVSSPSALSQAFLLAASQDPQRGGAKLGRLAVRKSERGKGYGDDLIRLAEDWLRQNLRPYTSSQSSSSSPSSCSSASASAPPSKEINICLSSQMQVQDFYKRHGFQPVGEPYIEEGAPHVWFTKRFSV